MSESTDAEGSLWASLCNLKTETSTSYALPCCSRVKNLEAKTPVLKHASDLVLGRQRQEDRVQSKILAIYQIQGKPGLLENSNIFVIENVFCTHSFVCWPLPLKCCILKSFILMIYLGVLLLKTFWFRVGILWPQPDGSRGPALISCLCETVAS